MSQSLLHYEQGKICYQNKKFDDAIFQFTEAIRLKPDSNQALARCYNARGVVYFYLGEFKKVIRDCTKALELDSENANYHNCRGNAYFSLGKFSKACEDFTAAISLSPEASHGRYYNNRGSAFRRLKQFKEAIEDYSKAISIDGKNGNYYNNRGNTYFDMGEFQLAIDDFTVALTLEPYSPKTKLTLAQAHEALAQEKRMKNSTQYEGVYSSVKKEGKHTKRKDRPTSIYVSPNGVEITYTRGWRKRKEQVSNEWSEDMKIELVDDSHVKLYLDKTRLNYAVIMTRDAPAVEEELIGRITTKFASYSTACLVAQHEGVCNEYADIVKHINDAKSELSILQSLLEDAEKQKESYVKEDKFDLANQSKTQLQRLQHQIEEKKNYIDSETQHAEVVRTKAEQEAGPVLDMVLIMQNRVRELYHNRVKDVKGQYKVEDLALEEQLNKMDTLVIRAQELAQLVSKPVTEIQKAFDNINHDDDEEEEEEHAEPTPAAAAEATPEPAAAAPEPTPEPTPEPAAPAPEPTPEPAAAKVNLADHKEDSDSDWEDFDEIDENKTSNLKGSFAPSGHEVFMTVEGHGGMVTIVPSRSTEAVEAAQAPGDVVVAKRDSVVVSEEQQQQAKRLAELEAARQAAEEKLSEKDAALQSLLETNLSLASIRAESEKLKEQLASRINAMESSSTELSSKLEMTAQEKEELQMRLTDQQKQVEILKANLDSVNKALMSKAQESDEKTERFEQMAEKSAELEKLISDMKSRSEADKAQFQSVQAEYNARMSKLKEESDQLKSALEATAAEKSELKQEVERQNMTMSELRQHLARMKADLERAAAEKDAAAKEKDAMARSLQEEKDKMEKEKEAVAKEKEKEIEKLKEQSRAEELKRRQLHNLIQEIKGNIRVYIRVRPDLKNANNGHKLYEEMPGSDGCGIRVMTLPEKSATGGAEVSKKYDFEYDRVFWPSNTQGEVFEEISQLVQSALDGFKVSIFAYGQTGSGKTYTMEGPDNPTAATVGMIPRSVSKIFAYRDEMMTKGWEYKCEVSFLEIYNQDIRDLLSNVPIEENKHEIRMIKDGKGTRTVVADLTTVEVKGPADLEPLLKAASNNRSSAATSSNERSSRSHSVFTLRITGENKQGKLTSEGVLNLVDLAGSERIDKSQVTGQRLEETKAINSSLTCLGDVIAALAQGAQHVPFRNSKLTYLLQDSFGGGSKTLMFINLAGEVEHVQETLCSLRFGSKVHDCHIGSAKKQVKGTEEKEAAGDKKVAKKKK